MFIKPWLISYFCIRIGSDIEVTALNDFEIFHNSKHVNAAIDPIVRLAKFHLSIDFGIDDNSPLASHSCARASCSAIWD